MLSRRGRPTESYDVRRAAVRDALFEAVQGLLADGRAYADLSINKMVAEAGIAKSTFYKYFTGKNDLLSSFIDEVVDAVGESYDWLDFEGSPTPAAIRSAVHSHVMEFMPYMPLMAAAFDAAFYDDELRESVDVLMASLTSGVARHIQFGQKQDWIDPDLPPAETGMWLTWMATRGVHKLVLVADTDKVEHLVAGISQMVWSALYGPCLGGDADADIKTA